jgi:MFS family permease
VETAAPSAERLKSAGIFYGWYIVAVGFLANVASSFALASTLSIFLKPLTSELGISRGVFSLLRSGEGIIAACLAPFIGSLVDRYGGRWLMVIGAAIAGIGFLFLGTIENFLQFASIRLTLVTLGDSMMGYMVVNVVVAQWFVRFRGRAFAVTSMGVGFAKVCMPILAASLLLALGWRQTWMVFGLLTMALLMLPALLLIRRDPESLGMHPDGAQKPPGEIAAASVRQKSQYEGSAGDPNTLWTRAEALRTSAFWLLVITFGISSVGVTGLNLHVYPYVTDIGHSAVIAATVMSVIASMQLASPLVWGMLAERIDPRIAAMLRFVVQGVGLALAISTESLICLYAGFFLYGIGLGGNMVLPDLLWANYFGRRSLGKVRGLGLLISQILAASGPPFFGFLFDITGGYGLSFAIFGAALATSAIMSLMLRPPQKKC